MIERTAAFKAVGNTFATLEEAQCAELCELLKGVGNVNDEAVELVAKKLVENPVKVVDILTTTATSKPRARKVNGGTKKRTPKTPAETPQPATT